MDGPIGPCLRRTWSPSVNLRLRVFRLRAGIEGRISVLGRCYGLDRCPEHRETGMGRLRDRNRQPSQDRRDGGQTGDMSHSVGGCQWSGTRQ